MKIYTITCTNAYNYGAVLQAYALQQYIERMGHDVEVIDYYPLYLRKISEKYKNNICIRLIRMILYAPDYTKSKIVFNKFKKKIKCTKKVYYSSEELKSLSAADLYIAGSDQIWNPYLKNGLDENYYLKFALTGKKISYAASVGVEIYDQKYDNFFKKILSDFSCITVREKKTAEYLNYIGIPASYVLDPVFLLNKSDWGRICSTSETVKYVVVYALHHIQEIYDYARRLADRIGVKMYVISVEIKEIRRGNDRFFWNPTVNQYIALIKNAEAVVTNSFHGVSFGLIFERPLHIFDTEPDDLRIKNLVDIFDLKERTLQIVNRNLLPNQLSDRLAGLMEKEITRSKDILNRLIER